MILPSFGESLNDVNPSDIKLGAEAKLQNAYYVGFQDGFEYKVEQMESELFWWRILAVTAVVFGYYQSTEFINGLTGN